MAKYLVTGGCGFIGSHLVDALISQGHDVKVLDNLSTGKRENVSVHAEVIVGDITNVDLVNSCFDKIDYCYHLAAITRVDKSNKNLIESHQVNQTGALNIFNAARKNKTPVVYASSSAVYGDNADIPLKESSEVRPLTAYAADKLGTEAHSRVASLVYGVPTLGLRFFNVYGPRQNSASPYVGMISELIERGLTGTPLTIYGDGEQTGDYIFITDAIQYLLKSMEKVGKIPSIYNVCSGEPVTINQLATTIIMLTNSDRCPLKYEVNRRNDISVSIGSCLKAKQQLNIEMHIPLIRGLRALIDYMFIEKQEINECLLETIERF